MNNNNNIIIFNKAFNNEYTIMINCMAGLDDFGIIELLNHSLLKIPVTIY